MRPLRAFLMRWTVLFAKEDVTNTFPMNICLTFSIPVRVGGLSEVYPIVGENARAFLVRVVSDPVFCISLLLGRLYRYESVMCYLG